MGLFDRFRESKQTAILPTDTVVFIVGPSGSGKSRFMNILFQNILLQKVGVYARVSKGQKPGTTEVHAERCRFDGMQSDTVIVDTPSFYTRHKPDGVDVLKRWMDSNYTKPCKAAAVLYMHNLVFNANDANLKVSRHLDAFRRTCRRNLIPSVVHVVPTLPYWAKLSEERIKTLVTQLQLQANEAGVQFCSMSSDGKPFDGQPETAWDVVQGLFSACEIEEKARHGHTGKAEVAENDDESLPLLSLASSLYEKFQKQGLVADIDEAISLARTASGLCPPGHPSHASSQRDLACYLQAKVRTEVARARPKRTQINPPYSGSSDIKQSITKCFFETVENLPPRLLHTSTGVMCNRDAQLSYFEGSPQYKRLLSSASSLHRQQLQAEISSALTDFFQIAMLSHRWGSGEPLLREVEGKKIYDLGGTDGLAKLQEFCLLALKRNFQWAWSDTCCIDKDSSAELQEAIGSMFSWYRRSSLTIVYLSDVSGPDSLANCIWFTRGWTLQELLASPAVLFYTYDWSLYTKSDTANHKTDPAVLEELQNATGVAKQHLTNFYPGMDDARSRLHWASRRSTTRSEDIAYSLFGIFKVHLPVLYGESAENALGRLLTEIISRSGDVSVLDWAGEASSFNSCFPANLVPYQTEPHVQLIPRDPDKRNGLDPVKARKLYTDLARLPLARCVNRRLTLPSTIHPVTTVRLQGSSTSPSRYTYEIRASRLRPISVTLSVELDEGNDTYILVRPWHPKLLEQQTNRDVDAMWKLLEQLEQPFNALLLKRLLHNEYKRIASDCTITTCVQDLASILDTEGQILEIV